MFLPMDQAYQEKFAIGAAKIALQNFHWQYATLVLFNSTLICSVDIFLRSYKKNVIVGRGIFFPSFVKRTKQYVIFGADLIDIIHMLTWMQRHKFDNTGTYIVVCESDQRVKCNEIDVVTTLWNYKIVNVVLINNYKEKTNGFIYYHPEDCKHTRPMNLQNWDSCAVKGHAHCQNVYPLKMKNLHQCPIIVSTFNQIPYMNIDSDTPTGSDGDLLGVIAKAMNFSVVVMTPRIGNGWGKVENNGSWSGSLADVFNDWANFSMTSGCITISRFATFHMSTDYAVITIGWVTHPSKVQPSSFKLLRPFQQNVRITLVISFVIFVLFKIFLKGNFLSLVGNSSNSRFQDNFVFYSWELCMGLPVNIFPTNKTFLYLAVLWIWYGFLIRTLYQVCLINSLQTDVYDPEFETIKEAIASKYTFGGGLALREYYIDSAFMYDEWKNVESHEILPVMVNLSQGLKFVLAMNIETTKMFMSPNPGEKLQILPQVIITTPTAIFFKKYSPLANPLNVVLSRLRESGIIQKIYLNNTGKKGLREELNNNIPITIVHYTGCYAILLTGWLLSSICFVVENLMCICIRRQELSTNNQLFRQRNKP